MKYQDLRISSHCRSHEGKPKRVYSSEQEAWDSADYHKHKCGIELHPYHCDRCGGWHLTKNHVEMVTSGENWSLV